ncbi:hypothetical protein TSOC_013807, partial [Tetrabaena socialis]
VQAAVLHVHRHLQAALRAAQLHVEVPLGPQQQVVGVGLRVGASPPCASGAANTDALSAEPLCLRARALCRGLTYSLRLKRRPSFHFVDNLKGRGGRRQGEVDVAEDILRVHPGELRTMLVAVLTVLSEAEALDLDLASTGELGAREAVYMAQMLRS